MDAPGPNSPDPGPQPTDSAGPSAAPFSAPPAATGAAAAPPSTRGSASAWLWSRRMPANPASWSRRGKITAALVAAALATTGGVAIADTSTPSPSASSSTGSAEVKPDAKGNLLMKRGGPMGMRLGMLGHGGMVHGEFTVPDGDGGYRTMLTQNGTVAGVDGNKLTVKSADGWSHDYTLDTSTMIGGQRFWSPEAGADLTTGQDVTVMATVKDGSAHADHVQTVPDKAMLEKRAGELKQKMQQFQDRGERVFKFRGGPGGELRMRGEARGMPGMGGELKVRPAPEAGTSDAPTPDMEPGFFVEEVPDGDLLIG